MLGKGQPCLVFAVILRGQASIEVEPMEHHTPDTSLPMAVHALENDELQALLIVLLREWRERVAVLEQPAAKPA